MAMSILAKTLACVRSSMEAIRINTTLNSDTLYLPQVRPLIGKSVEIIVREEAGTDDQRQNGQYPQRDAWKAALASLAGLDIDWDAYRRQRELDVRSASDQA
jgi:hypothetical protein